MNDEPTVIKSLDAYIAAMDPHISPEEAYTIALGVAVFRLNQLIGPQATAELVMAQVEALRDIPKTDLRKLN